MNTIIATIGLSTILATVAVASDDFEKRAVTIWSLAF